MARFDRMIVSIFSSYISFSKICMFSYKIDYKRHLFGVDLVAYIMAWLYLLHLTQETNDHYLPNQMQIVSGLPAYFCLRRGTATIIGRQMRWLPSDQCAGPTTRRQTTPTDGSATWSTFTDNWQRLPSSISMISSGSIAATIQILWIQRYNPTTIGL